MLQPRRKWRDVQRNLQEGDLVLLRSSDEPRNQWPLARITAAHPSPDGIVRQVEVLTTKGGVRKTYRRPVKELLLNC